VHDLELWNAAYDVLKRDSTSSALVLAYESIISHALPDSLRPGHNGNGNGLPTEGDRRAEHMMMIAKSGLEREVKEVSQTDSGDGEARENLIQTRSIIASLLDDQPSAAIAWAGFCSLTPVRSNSNPLSDKTNQITSYFLILFSGTMIFGMALFISQTPFLTT
jgi:hypothetical protein